MCDPVCMHPFQETQIVDMLGDVRKQVGNILTALTILLEFPRRPKHTMLGDRFGFGKHASVIEFDHFTVAIGKRLFVVERINVTWPALHEQENDAFRAGGKVPRF